MQDLDLGKTTVMPVRQRVVHDRIPNQILRIMKCVIICILAFCIQANAGVYSQSITFSGKNVPLQKVFTAIEKQTNYVFFYNDEILRDAKPVTLNVTNVSITVVMQECLKGQPLEFSIEDKTVFVTKKAARAVVYVEEAKPPIDVSGRVTDDQGNPLVGASVKVRGTNKGATTDKEGRFLLNDVEENALLEISFVGHEVQTILVRGQRVLSISLTQKLSMLDETVVIAYGTTTKRLNTGNVATVKAQDLARQPVSNPLLALQGRVPGLLITQSNGLPGSGITVRVQGNNSISAGNDPLYIIDGVPYTSQLLPTWGTILGSSGGFIVNGNAPGNGNPLSFINPADIESIEILKDADATAIYGSRAANGAILITTKKGRPGELKVDLNLQQGWGKITNRLDLLNTEQYLEMRNEALKNDGLTPSASPTAASPFIYAPDLKIWDSTSYTNWQKVLLGGTAHYTDIQGAVSGGNATTQFRFGVGYHRETTVFPGDFSDQKGSIQLSINSISPNQKFKIQVSGSYLMDDNKLFNADLTTVALRTPPNAPALYNEDGSINWAPNSLGTTTWALPGNPVAALFNKYKIKTSNLIGNTIISYQILPSLELKSSFGYNSLRSDEIQTQPLISTPPESRSATLRSSRFGNNTINTFIIEPQAVFKHKLAKGKLEALLGTTIQQTNSSGERLQATGFNSDVVLEDIKSATSITVPFATILSTYKYFAVFGRVNYNWSDRYIINFSARRDGSSRFGVDNQFNNFGAVGIGWIFSKENFLTQYTSLLSYGKLRGSYGLTGSDQIGDYRFMDLYSTPFGVGVPYHNTSALQPTGLPNPYLEWEETRKLQAGIDLGLINDRILLTANYIHNRSSNQLLSYLLPVVTGFTLVTRNFPATVDNTNWEFSLNTINIKTKNFRWSSNINLTVAKNELIDFPNLETSSYASLLAIGQPITVTKAYQFLEVNPQTGVFQYADANGNATSTPNFFADRTVFINTMPTLFGGIQNNFTYGRFELDLLFQFVKQKKQNYFFGNVPGALRTNQPVTILDRWQKAGDIAVNQRYNSNASLSTAFSNIYSSNVGYSDASFVRLKNISLSWNLPSTWQRKLHLHNCRLYAQGQNLLTFTDFEGMDPETGNSSLPPLKVLTIGIQIVL